MTQPNEDAAAKLAEVRASLVKIDTAVDYMTDLDGQDRDLVIEMFQDMLNDVIEDFALKPMVKYVRHYCDVIDSLADAERIASEI